MRTRSPRKSKVKRRSLSRADYFLPFTGANRHYTMPRTRRPVTVVSRPVSASNDYVYTISCKWFHPSILAVFIYTYSYTHTYTHTI